MRRRLAPLPLLLALLSPLALAGPADAGIYEVNPCRGDELGGVAPGLQSVYATGNAPRSATADGCSVLIEEARQTYDSVNGLTLRITSETPNLRIRGYRGSFNLAYKEGSAVIPSVLVNGREVWSRGATKAPGDFFIELSGLDTRQIEAQSYCSFSDGAVDCVRFDSYMFGFGGRFAVEDPVIPDAASLSGPPTGGGATKGTVEFTVRGGDLDSGVRTVAARLGETAIGSRNQPESFGQWRRYPRTAQATFSLDTTKLADATYPLTATVTDAGGLTRDASGGDVVIDNLPPVPTGRPGISGATDAGQTLTAFPGTWKDLNGSGFAYQWQRCDAAGDLCLSIPNATGATYTATGTDVGARLRVVVVATDASGTATQTSDPSGQVTGVATADAPYPPTLLGVRGLSNPLAGRGAVPNGTSASDAAKLDLALRKGRRGKRRTLVGAFGSRPTLVGTLKVGSTPVAGALVTIAERQAGGIWRAATTVTTSARGGIAATLPAGPNRTLRAYYFPTGASTTAVTSRTLGAGTKARVSFTVTPSIIRNKESVRLVGRVSGVSSPRGVLVSAQVRVGRRRWQAFRVARTDAAGNYRTRYRFLRSRRGERYSFRAVAKRQAGLPYDTGTSRTARVRIR